MKNLIYLIDDDDDIRGAMSYALKHEGYHVQELPNGKAALDQLLTASSADLPSLIITDYYMPVMDGVEFIEEVKTNYADSIGRIPIALSTAKGSMEKDDRVPDDIICISKPMNLQDLIELARLHCLKSPTLN